MPFENAQKFDQKKLDSFCLNNVIPLQKETLQEHTKHLFVLCRLVCIPKPNQSSFFIILRQVAENIEIWKIYFSANFAVI